MVQTGINKVLLDKGLNSKLNNLNKYGRYDHTIYDKLVFKKTK